LADEEAPSWDSESWPSVAEGGEDSLRGAAPWAAWNSWRLVWARSMTCGPKGGGQVRVVVGYYRYTW
jgi:hypothetical protein